MIMELGGMCQVPILVINIVVTLEIIILIELEFLVMLIEIVVQISEAVLVIGNGGSDRRGGFRDRNSPFSYKIVNDEGRCWNWKYGGKLVC